MEVFWPRGVLGPGVSGSGFRTTPLAASSPQDFYLASIFPASKLLQGGFVWALIPTFRPAVDPSASVSPASSVLPSVLPELEAAELGVGRRQTPARARHLASAGIGGGSEEGGLRNTRVSGGPRPSSARSRRPEFCKHLAGVCLSSRLGRLLFDLRLVFLSAPGTAFRLCGVTASSRREVKSDHGQK